MIPALGDHKDIFASLIIFCLLFPVWQCIGIKYKEKLEVDHSNYVSCFESLLSSHSLILDIELLK